MIEGTEKPNGTARLGRRPRQDVHLLEGTKLLREWRGVTHEVTVVGGGYEHQGRRYRIEKDRFETVRPPAKVASGQNRSRTFSRLAK